MSLDSSLPQLAQVVELCRDRIDPAIHRGAQSTLDKAGSRLSFSPEVTVIAIAGATGAGKSSLFNSLSRTALAQVGVRRPMTTDAMAITFGDIDTTGLLDWLKIPQRHVVAGGDLEKIVLLDLADFDSVEKSHRDEFDRLIEVVDQFLWVVDPQKYADAVLHERYLRRYASHGEVMTFVLNHVDKLAAGELKAIEKDFSQILEADGITRPKVFLASAATDWGVDKLRAHLAKLARARQAHIKRLEADMRTHAQALNSQMGVRPAGTLGKQATELVVTGCMEAAGVDQVVDAVQVSYARRGKQMTGLPWLSWMPSLKIDPLKRLHLNSFPAKKKKAIESSHLERTSLVAHPVAQARIDMAMRTVSEEAVSRLPSYWGTVVGARMKEQASCLPDSLDQAVVGTNLGLSEGNGWWKLVRFLQWVFFLVVVAGLAWLAVNFVLTTFLGFPRGVSPKIGNLPLPTWMLISGFVLGLVVAGLSRVGVWLGARAATAKARKRLRTSLEKVTAEMVIDPCNEELTRHDTARRILLEVLA